MVLARSIGALDDAHRLSEEGARQGSAVDIITQTGQICVSRNPSVVGHMGDQLQLEIPEWQVMDICQAILPDVLVATHITKDATPYT